MTFPYSLFPRFDSGFMRQSGFFLGWDFAHTFSWWCWTRILRLIFPLWEMTSAFVSVFSGCGLVSQWIHVLASVY